MPPKRKFAEIEPLPAVPPSLPPSVEEAYRRKCVQLKNRTNEVEDANDAARLRLARIKRQVEKLRIERAFLLEQLAKRTSTNVEDSEGSPSPPPAEKLPDFRNGLDTNIRKVKDKPVRIKRGLRKSAGGNGEPKAGASKEAASPASDGQLGGDKTVAAEVPASPEAEAEVLSPNGGAKSSGKGAISGFRLYYSRMRSRFEADNGDEGIKTKDELERSWAELPESEKEEYQAEAEAQYDAEMAEKAPEKEDKEPEEPAKKEGGRSEGDGDNKTETLDEDVEMTNYDTEEQEAQMDKDGDE